MKAEYKDIIEIINDYILSDENKIKAEESPDTPLDEFKIDSVMIIKMLVLVEEKYDIEFEIEEMVPDNLNTIRKITDSVNKKLSTFL